jgi:hypothetical protein
MLSYAGSVRLGVAADEHVIADPEAIVEAFHDALDELSEDARRASGPPAGDDRWRTRDREVVTSHR